MLNMVLGEATHSFELMLASFILGLAMAVGHVDAVNTVGAPVAVAHTAA